MLVECHSNFLDFVTAKHCPPILQKSVLRTLSRRIYYDKCSLLGAPNTGFKDFTYRFKYSQFKYQNFTYTIVNEIDRSLPNFRRKKKQMLSKRGRSDVSSSVYSVIRGEAPLTDLIYALNLSVNRHLGIPEVSRPNYSSRHEAERIANLFLGNNTTVHDISIGQHMPKLGLRPYRPVPDKFELFLERLRLCAYRYTGQCEMCEFDFSEETLDLDHGVPLYSLKCCNDRPHKMCHVCVAQGVLLTGRCPWCDKIWDFSQVKNIPIAGPSLLDCCLIARVTGTTWEEIVPNLQKFDTDQTSLNIPGEHLGIFIQSMRAFLPKFGELQLDLEQLTSLFHDSSASGGFTPIKKGPRDTYTPSKKNCRFITSILLSSVLEDTYYYAGKVDSGKITRKIAKDKMIHSHALPYLLKLKLETIIHKDLTKCRLFAIPPAWKIVLDYWLAKPITNFMYNRLSCLIGHSWQKNGAEVLMARLLVGHLDYYKRNNVRDDPYMKIDLPRATVQNFDDEMVEEVFRKTGVRFESFSALSFKYGNMNWFVKMCESVLERVTIHNSCAERLIEWGDQNRADMVIKALMIGMFYQMTRQTYTNCEDTWMRVLFDFMSTYSTERPMNYIGDGVWKEFVGSLASGEWITSICQTLDKFAHAFAYQLYIAEKLKLDGIKDPITGRCAGEYIFNDAVSLRFQTFRFINYADDLCVSIEKFYSKYMSLCDTSRLEYGYLSMSDYFENKTGFKIKPDTFGCTEDPYAKVDKFGEVVGEAPNILKRYLIKFTGYGLEDRTMSFKQTSDLLPKLLKPAKEVSKPLQLVRCLGSAVDAGGTNPFYYKLLSSHARYIVKSSFSNDPKEEAERLLDEMENYSGLDNKLGKDKVMVFNYVIEKLKRSGMTPASARGLVSLLEDEYALQNRIIEMFDNPLEKTFQVKKPMSMEKLIAGGHIRRGFFPMAKPLSMRLDKMKEKLLNDEAEDRFGYRDYL